MEADVGQAILANANADALEGYYAHPWAWDEIGFGGPAYPRAYTRLERGEPEPWEVEERRYEWVVRSARCGVATQLIESGRTVGEPAVGTSGPVEERIEDAAPGGAFEARNGSARTCSARCRRSTRHAALRDRRRGRLSDRRGVGSAGGVLLQRLARAGFNVVGMEAGPFWDTERDWVSDEAGSHELYWEDHGSPAARIRWHWAPTTAARESAAVRCTGRPSRPASSLGLSKSIHATASARIGRSL